MIEFGVEASGRLTVGQRTISPDVYLDHWALRQISSNPALRARFKQALGNGTLHLSWLNVGEFAAVTDQRQLDDADELVESILPNVFFLQVSPFVVIERENRLIAGGPAEPPHADNAFLEAFIHLKPDSVAPFTARGLFAASRGSLRLDVAALADEIVSRIAAFRKALEDDQAFEVEVGRLPASHALPHATRDVLRELLRTLLIDERLQMNGHHAIDLLHAVVPVSYANFVLLDRHWEVQVERVRVRLQRAVIKAPLARVFSAKANGLERFLSTLESLHPAGSSESSGEAS